MKFKMTQYRIGLLCCFLLAPLFLWGQVLVSTDNSYDIGSDSDMEWIDTIVVMEYIEEGDSLSYLFADSADYEWYFFLPDSLPKLLVPLSRNTKASVALSLSGTYQLKTADTSFYFAVLDDSEFQAKLDTVWVDDSGDSCQSLRLRVRSLQRDSAFVFSPKDSTSYLLVEPTTYYQWENVDDSASTSLSQAAPFQDTVYFCSPFSDDFFPDNEMQVQYYMPDTLATVLYEAKAVSLGELFADIVDDDPLTNRLTSSSKTEGSAPLDVTYTITPSSSVDYSDWWVWDITEDQPNSSIYPFQDQITYTFLEYVTNGYRVKVEVGNNFCQATDSTEIKVYESGLEAPNVMVLDGSYGKYKLAYQSIDPETFRATIYDRWGRRLYQWTDPDGGWDGRSSLTDAFVSPGVYYCSVRARGTDGKKHDDLFEITAIQRKK